MIKHCLLLPSSKLFSINSLSWRCQADVFNFFLSAGTFSIRSNNKDNNSGCWGILIKYCLQKRIAKFPLVFFSFLSFSSKWSSCRTFSSCNFKLFSTSSGAETTLTLSLSFTGRNGLHEFQRIAMQENWIVLAYETFDITPDQDDVDVTSQLERIKDTGNKIEISCLVCLH